MKAPSLSILAVIFFSATGCASAARDMARATTPTVINSSLRALNDTENQRLMTQLMSAPEMHEAAHAFANDIADGALSALAEPERMARVEAMTTRYMATLMRVAMRTMAASMRQDLAPAIAEVMRQTMASTLREVMRESYQHDIERVVSGLTRAAVEGAGHGMADTVARDLGPALRTALANEETARAVGAAGRVLAREAVLGSNDAMTQIQRAQDRGARPSFLSRLSNLTENGVQIFRMVAAAAIALCLALGFWVARLYMRGRRIEAESERNAASAVMFAEAIRAAEGKPWSNELTELLRDRLQHGAVGDLLDQVLTHPRKKSSRGAQGSQKPPIGSATQGA